MKSLRVSRSLPLILTLAASTVNAFEPSGNFWEEGEATYLVGMVGVSPSGISWNQAFIAAMGEWSASTSFQFNVVEAYHDPCIERGEGEFGDGVVGVDFTATVCGDAFGENTLAVTLTAGFCMNPECTGGFFINDADIVFREDEIWDIYDGTLRFDAIDFQRVALHELGHALGLNHETTNNAIMQPLISDLDTLSQDDINGVTFLYGGEGGSPVENSVSTVYGINVVLPNTTDILGPSDIIGLNGSLSADDTVLDGRFLDLYQFTFTADSNVDIQLDSADIDPFLISSADFFNTGTHSRLYLCR